MGEEGSAKHGIQVLLVGAKGSRRLIDQEIGDDSLMVSVRSGEDVPVQLQEHDFHVLVSDFEADGGQGSVRVLRGSRNGEEVVVVAEGGGDSAGGGRPLGAVTRPLPPDMLQSAVAAAESAPGDIEPNNGLVVESGAMRAVLDKIQRVASSSASVMLTGETGVGKSVFARAIHDSSLRRGKAFVVVNCNALQETLLESELFGHEKGAFTGAITRKKGLLEVADGGTLFLDEVGDMGPAMQAKLLTFLDTGEFRRVGGTKTEKVDVRIVAATNKSLDDEVAAGRFREDLLFRLAVINLLIPPLRDRPEDLHALIDRFLKRHGPERRISDAALTALKAYPWPGNVRELANTVEGLCLMAASDSIDVNDLPAKLRSSTNGDGKNGLSAPTATELASATPDEAAEPVSMAEIERLHVERVLRHTGGKKAPAARILGVDVKTLASKIKKYGISS